MNQSLDALHEETKELEKLMAGKIQQTKSKINFELDQGRAVFLPGVRKRHRAMARRAWRMLWESSFLVILTSPVIYSLIIPRSMLDLLVSVYQRICFPIYGNGVLAYGREIAARTEQYWCPIKHARMSKGVHSRQCLYCDFGDADAFLRDCEKLRTKVEDTQSGVESRLKG